MDHDMWRPPVNRLMRTLDRTHFQQTVELRAARVFENQHISRCRSALERSKDALIQERIASVQSDPDPERKKIGKKCILLRPVESKDGRSTATYDNPKESQPNASDSSNNLTGPHHSPTVTELIQQEFIDIIPFNLHLDYTFWTYHDILSAILPEDEQGEIPSGFSQVGHVAHLNLRDEYLKHKYLIAEILIDKNPSVRTVINKIDDVGEENEYRTFKYEVLAGPNDMNVTVSEENCIFQFDYSKVYWNTRLNTEHRRLVGLFHEGEAVCDVMAGVGPFAVPAGKKRVFVWANDLNPESYASLQDAIRRNKVQDYVQPFSEDGRSFIRDAVVRLAQTDRQVQLRSKPPSRRAKDSEPQQQQQVQPLKTMRQPRTFEHFVLNLPASALTFLPSFIGLYTPSVRSLIPHEITMPLIHVYCFNTKSDNNIAEGVKICEEISQLLQFPMTPGAIEEGKEGRVEIYDVRDVAPKKRMFCASFRLPSEVAFREMS